MRKYFLEATVFFQKSWNEVVDFISGQNSDGLGEGYEQQEIRTDNGEIYVSFWHYGDDYFVYDGKEFTDYLTHRNDMKLGGMSI